MASAFSEAGEVNTVLFLGKGGKCITDLRRFDKHRIQAEHAVIAILVIEDNEEFWPNSPKSFTISCKLR